MATAFNLMASTVARRIDLKHPDRSQVSPYFLWSIHIDPVTMSEAVARLVTWIESGERHCHFVVTPNVDHVVQLHLHAELQPIYNNASLILADGWPLVTMSRFYGKRLPERVPGSDLFPALCDDFQRRGVTLRVFLLGGKPGVPERAAKNMEQRWPSVQVVGTSSPEFGFEKDPACNRRLVAMVNSSNADVLVLGLGFPKQEMWINLHCNQLKVPVALAIGATIDFIAGEQKRAPTWVRKIRMEWFQRLITNPRRLARRYATDALVFPYVCFLEIFKKSNAVLVERTRKRNEFGDSVALSDHKSSGK